MREEDARVCSPLARITRIPGIVENKQADDVVFAQLTRLYCAQTHRIHLLIHRQAESTAELSLNVLSKSQKDESIVKTILFIGNQINRRQIFHNHNSLSLNLVVEWKRKSKKKNCNFACYQFFDQNKRKTKDMHCERKKLPLFLTVTSRLRAMSTRSFITGSLAISKLLETRKIFKISIFS